MVIGIIENPPDNDTQEGYFISQTITQGCGEVGKFEREVFFGIETVLEGIMVAGLRALLAGGGGGFFPAGHAILSFNRQAGQGG